MNKDDNLNIYDIYNLILKKIEKDIKSSLNDSSNYYEKKKGNNEEIVDINKSKEYSKYVRIFKPIIEKYKIILDKPIKIDFIKNKSKDINDLKDNLEEQSRALEKISNKNKLELLDDIENEFVKKLNEEYNNKEHQTLFTYINKLINQKYKNNNIDDNYYKCDICKGTNFANFNDHSKICVDCGLEINIYMYTVDNIGFNQLQHINLNQKYKYEKICHFRDTVNQFQTKQNKFIPSKIFDDLEDMIEKHGLKNKDVDQNKDDKSSNRKEVYSKVSKKHIRDFLSETNNNKYYEDLQLFYCKITGKIPPDISHLEKKLYEDFENLVDAFLKISNHTNRKNFLNSQYVLKQLLRRYNYHVKDEDLSMLKTPARIREHDEIYEKCCDLLNWNYQPL
jgi:hypothetical protein